MGPPPRVPLVLLLLLAVERTARGTFPEEPGPIAVAPEDCECPPWGAWVGMGVQGGGARLVVERGWGFGVLWGGGMRGTPMGRGFGVKAGEGTPIHSGVGYFGVKAGGGHPWAGLGEGGLPGWRNPGGWGFPSTL